MANEFRIDGLAELNKALQELPARIEANVLRGGMRAASKVMESEVKANVPVDDGDLKNSIKVRTRNKRGEVSASVTAGDKKAFYARFVEFGTAAHFIKPKNRKSLFFAGLAREVVDHPGQPARPFMRPAFDAAQGPALEAFKQYVADRIPKEFKKAGK